jgi:pyruvate-formate lyase
VTTRLVLFSQLSEQGQQMHHFPSDAEHWLKEAKALRGQAEETEHRSARETLLKIAQSYEEIAQQMEAAASR